jgi:hypothetical protein
MQVEVANVKDVEGDSFDMTARNDMQATEHDMLEAEEKARNMSLPRCMAIIRSLVKLHKHDQNFPVMILEKMQHFTAADDVSANPERHADLIHEMKLEAVLVSENSPYAEVRAVVDNFDDPNTPSLTLRTWFLGTLFVIGGAFINQLFSIRLPAITITSNVAQLLACKWTGLPCLGSSLIRTDPCGKLLERVLPDKGFTFRGVRHSLNPGRFSKKEHMLITIMAAVGFNTPYSANVILSQYLPQYFNQSYAADFAYQILIGLGTNFIGWSS